MTKKWDMRFIALCQHVALWSKDSTQVGAVLAHGNRVVGIGYNGLPAGIKDTPGRLLNRDIKLALTLHAEQNAIAMAGDKAKGATLYTWPLPPCSHCASLAIQSGVKRIVAPAPSPALAERWGSSLNLASDMLKEAGVKAEIVDA